ncbi:MAG: putative PEP-binding protein, partial [Fusobacteriaceae bacterium]
LCRTEHMFFKDERIWSMREMILSKTLEERKKALAKIEPYQREDFKAMFKILGDKPLNIRLLDPPLHEFLPKSENDMKKMAEIMKLSLEEIEFRNSSLEEHNPMLGHRGCRLAITYPEIYVMQVKALVEAAIEVKQEGGIPNFEIMIPLVLSREELKVVKKLIEEEIVTILKEKKEKLEYKIGTMIELPRACVAAGEIAHEAEFFSFGTNDLTQTTLGISRDDSAKFIEEYKNKKIFEKSPFEVLDRDGVGQLMKMAVEKGRMSKQDLEIGICGEHGGESSSIEFCESIGLNYVSCSPYRVTIAILSAAQSTIKNQK